jgi:transcriptional regulator with XRE-family HTH domain
MDKIGEKLKQLRKSKGLSQSQVAEASGLTQASYASIETGKTKSISIQVGKGLAKILDQDFNLLFDVDHKENDQSRLIEELKKEIESLQRQLEDNISLKHYYSRDLLGMKSMSLNWIKEFYYTELEQVEREQPVDKGKSDYINIHFKKKFKFIDIEAGLLAAWVKNGLLSQDEIENEFKDQNFEPLMKRFKEKITA